jgi:subtilisin family serine protease
VGGGKHIGSTIAAATLAAVAVASAHAGGPGGNPGNPGSSANRQTILVQFAQPGYNNDDLVDQNGDQADGMTKTKTVIVKLPPNANINDKIAEYLARPDVIFAEPNGVVSSSDDYTAQDTTVTSTDPTVTAPAPTDTAPAPTDTTAAPATTDAPVATDTTATTTTTTTDPAATTGVSAASATVTANDTYLNQEWDLTTVRAFDAWALFPGSFTLPAGPTIAIVDSGIDSLHPDLFGTVATDQGANCLTGVCVSDGAGDDYGHGTHVAGIVAAHANDGVGIAGLAYGAQLMPVKVLDAAGNGTYASIAAGIIWATDHGARIVNLSLGSTAYSQTVCDAVTYAVNAGAVVVAAAGNNGTSTAFYPAACPGAIGVAATDSTDTRASFSETSYPNVFVSAPGVSILSDIPGGGFKTDSGTSMATPLVSGLAYLLLAQNPARSVKDVKMMLAGSSDKIGAFAYASDPYATCACTWNGSYGYGRINAYRALTEAPPAAAVPDFTLSSSATTLTVPRSKSAAVTVSSTGTSGFSSAVALAVTGLPSGATATFSPTSVAGTASSTLTVTASSSTAYGSYPLTVKGTSGNLVRTTPLTLFVPAPDYTLKLSNTAATAAQGDKPTTSISLTNTNGFAGTVSLAVSGAPAGVTTSLSSTSISGTRTSTLTMTTTSTTAPGTYPITITGTSGSLVHTAVYTLTVAQAIPDFTLVSGTTSTSVRYSRGSTIAYKLTVTPKFGFKGAVAMSASGMPSTATGSWSPATVSVTSTSAVYSTYTLVVPANSPVGTYTVTFTGTATNGTAHTATAKITIS